MHLLAKPASTEFQYSVQRYVKRLKSQLKVFAQPNAKAYGSVAMLHAVLEAVAALPLEPEGGPYASDPSSKQIGLTVRWKLLMRLYFRVGRDLG